MKKHVINFILFLGVSFYTSGISVALARWATQEDMQQILEHKVSNIYIDKEGISKTIEQREYTILKEAAKKEWSNLKLTYSPKINTYKILEAKTTINNKEYFVNSDKIEDAPIISSSLGFDRKNKINIPYPAVEINAKVFLKFEKQTLQAIIKNHYLELFSFENECYTKSDITNITSELPLHIEIYDPNNIIKVSRSIKHSKNNTLYNISIVQKRPFLQSIINENLPILNPKNISYVAISSLKSWSEFVKPLATEYDKIKNQPLPPLYQQIAAVAKTKNTDIEKIDTITSMLAEKITYLIVDKSSIQGNIIPQNLEQVAKTQLGDCKDFSMATSVILNAIGIKSNVALVKRGETLRVPPLALPNASYFNHAIVKVELPNQILWVDPTNFHSMISPTFADIANKPAIVLDLTHSNIETIPDIKPEQNIVKIEETVDLKNLADIKTHGRIQLTGIQAIPFTGLQRKVSDESIKFMLIDYLNHDGQIIDKNIILPNLKSTIVEDLEFNYNFSSRNFGLQTNVGVAIPIRFKATQRFKSKDNTVSNIYLGPPTIVENIQIIENINALGKIPLGCEIKSPWADFKRTVKYAPNKIIVHQTMKIKKSWIESQELNSKPYKKLLLSLNEHFNKGVAINFEPQ